MEFNYRNALNSQIRDAYGKVTYTYKSHLKDMDILERQLKQFKRCQIFLSALSSSGIISTIIYNSYLIKILAALISAFLLGINLYFKNFDTSKQITEHREAADKLWMIMNDYISVMTDFSQMSNEKIIAKRDELQCSSYDIYRGYIKTTPKGYKMARESLKYNEEQYFTFDEIDHLLPEQLRHNRYFK